MSETAYIEPEGAEFLCGDCASESAESSDSGLTDCPKHCAVCGVPLDFTLSPAGVQYVIAAINEAMQEGEESRNRIMPAEGTAEETMTHYHGSRHVEIVRGWAENIRDYGGLEEREYERIACFLEWTEQPRRTPRWPQARKGEQ